MASAIFLAKGVDHWRAEGVEAHLACVTLRPAQFLRRNDVDNLEKP